MNVLFVGRADSPVLAYLREVEAHVASTSRRLHRADPRVRRADFLVSHGYRHRISARLLARFPGRAVNLHNSLLPWNRGMDATLWSFVDGTPKGVTIHHMDAGIDTGDIIVQKELRFAGDETLRSAWWRLQAELVQLFEDHWPMIRKGRCPGRPQPAGGSYHFSADRNAVVHLLTEGWDTPVSALTAPAQPGVLTPQAVHVVGHVEQGGIGARKAPREVVEAHHCGDRHVEGHPSGDDCDRPWRPCQDQ